MHTTARLALHLAAIFLVTNSLPCVTAQTTQSTTQSASPLARRYVEGEKLIYRMQGDNEGWKYEVVGTGTVKKDANGHFVEEFGWSDFKSSAPMQLSAQSLAFRHNLSLDPANPPSIPNLSQVQPFLIGPITDMLTFYSDLWLAIRNSQIAHTGDHMYVPLGTPASWADGNYVILGEDSIDFDVTLQELNASTQVATLVVRHVPPSHPKVKLPAAWMQAPVDDTLNNFVNVAKDAASGKYTAAVGKETFDVELKVSLKDGKILSATLENLVKTRVRECSDAAFEHCNEPQPHQIHRHITLQLEPQ